MENTIILVILLAVIVFALLRIKKHFKGGGCCGSSSTSVRSRKKLTEPKLGQFILTVEGMHCENCRNRVEHMVNRLDGVVCRVDLKRKTATISYSTPVSIETARKIVEDAGYSVSAVQE